MDRNTIIGFSLILLILVGYAWWTAPSEAELALEQKKQDSIARVEAARVKQADSLTAKKDTAAAASPAVVASNDSLLQQTLGGFAASLKGTPETITLANKDLTVNISNKGARITSVRLNNYKRSDSSDLIMFDDKNSSFYYIMALQNDSLRTDQFYWKTVKKSANSVTLRLEDGKGAWLDQTYTLNAQNFMVDYKLDVHGMQNTVLRAKPDIHLNWNVALPRQERLKKLEDQQCYPMYKIPGENPESLGATGEKDEEEIKGKIQWVSFKQQYFNSTLLSKDAFSADGNVSWSELKDPALLKQMHTDIYLPYGFEENKSYDMKWYFGPNHFQTLKNLNTGIDDHEMQRIVTLGWGIFGWVNRFIVIPVFNFLDDYIGNMGIIILLLTLIIKFLLLPLVYKSYISTAKMRILKPEIDEIKEKHGNDMQKVQTENMALYRKAGVSPMSGCVPMLLQMPILFAMFQFFPNAFELRQKSFLWAPDLSQYDSILELGFHIPGYGDHISLFTLMMTVSTLIYTRLNNQISGVTGQMKWIGYLMPIIFLGVLNDYASGLTWYYFVSNMVTFGQQAVIRRFVDDKKLHAQIADARKKPVKKSAFSARLEAAMKQAQSAQQQQKNAKNTGKGPKKK
jgi:YidC/Oxa1 family membrane protein insertase